MKRRKFSAEFKTKVVLEALSERYSLSEVAERHKVHPNQIANWKRQFLDNASTVFNKKGASSKPPEQTERDQLLKKIGELQIENDFIKKSLGIKG